MVSIHAPREGCDGIATEALIYLVAFQFTHPGRGATRASATRSRSLISFNSRTPGGVRLDAVVKGVESKAFQFTHPGRGATYVDFKR